MTLTDEQKSWIKDSAKACEKQILFNESLQQWFEDYGATRYEDAIEWQPHIPGPAGAWDREQICRACCLAVIYAPECNGSGYIYSTQGWIVPPLPSFTDPQSEAWAIVQAGAEVWRARNSERYSFVTYGKGKK